MDLQRLHILSQTPSLANQFISELRDVTVQKDSLRFRRNLERLGEIMAYRISETLPFEARTVQTPLEETEQMLLQDFPVLATVLRAGLPFHQGFLNYFDHATCAFIGAYRVEGERQLSVHLDYMAAPSLENKILILADPMLATGKSLIQTYRDLLRLGTPTRFIIAAVIASPEGVAHIHHEIPEAEIWVGALDERLNDHAYIVPGLGDAGDLAFGAKK
ncbi:MULTISPECIES: uracil phosphoribosyltransferase [Rufibacter]|uniref:Uracil phosphoribosyltransferase n=1 Tax=Rufibacter quisquiliarum TaxID=1549639 RepID=A0A839GV24_9BACT|nr:MULTISPECIES: uracil phosphoribosyltransferase [Rufibacter]MBA9079335.1 uracil phosphoribosyltransferase [Rufibacter quisquiliarum]